MGGPGSAAVIGTPDDLVKMIKGVVDQSGGFGTCVGLILLVDFVEMLRSAIKQDEWLLFVHGGALGLFAGFLHLAIFGV